MDLGTIIGLVVGMGCVLASVIMGGGNLVAFWDMPSFVCVIGGAAGAVIMSFPLARVLKIHAVFLKTIFFKLPAPTALIKDMVKYAEIARREGILSLEGQIAEMEKIEPFLARGMKMAVDGADPELIKGIMETEAGGAADRHAGGKKIIDTLGKYAPAYGMIGTLLGLILMLQNMSDPSTIGGGMAVALVTTLYGAIISNVITGPVGDKLAARDGEEFLVRAMIIEGVMSIQSGDNPRVVESKLLTFLAPAERAAWEKAAAAAA